MTAFSALLLFMPVVAQAGAKELTIEEVRRQPYALQGQFLRLCGEILKDGNIIYSDTIYPMHGRVGVKLRGYAGRGRGQCVTGFLLRADGRVAAEGENIVITDAPIHPDYVLVAEPS